MWRYWLLPWHTLSRVEIRWFSLQEGPHSRGWTSFQSPNEWTHILQTSTGTVSVKPPVRRPQHTLTTATWLQLRLRDREGASQDLSGGTVISYRVVQPQAQRPEWVHGTGGHVFVGLQPIRKKTFLFFFLIEVQLIYSVILVSGVRQSDSDSLPL